MFIFNESKILLDLPYSAYIAKTKRDIYITCSYFFFICKVNVSPALSNDCEVDSEVKKPLLHDLFDLLGLPVCNTGLSLFTIWDSADIEEEDESNRFYHKCLKKRCKIGREPMKVVNFCSETKLVVIQKYIIILHTVV